MSHRHLDPSVPDRPKRVAIVLWNPAASSITGWPVSGGDTADLVIETLGR